MAEQPISSNTNTATKPTPSESPFGQKKNAPSYTQRKRASAASEYKKSLVEKQTLKHWYGLSERQFKKYVKNTLAKMGKVDDVSNELIRVLEKRLDNVIFRIGFAKTRAQARQLVSHGFFNVNGRRVNIPSYQVDRGDVVSLRGTKTKKGIFKDLDEQMKNREVPSWLSYEKAKLEAVCKGEPTLLEVKPPAEISLIFEFYSK